MNSEKAEQACIQAAKWPWRLILGIVGIGIGIALAVEAYQDTPKPGLDATERHHLLTNSLPRLASKEVARRLVGFQRIVEMEIKAETDDISAWRAIINAEYLNKIGGPVRTNMTIFFAQSMGVLEADQFRLKE